MGVRSYRLCRPEARLPGKLTLGAPTNSMGTTDFFKAAKQRRRTSLYSEEFGHGDTPFLLLHGLGGGVSTWREVAEIMAPNHHILIVDLLGFGRSPRPDIGYTVDDHLTALENFLEETGLASKVINIAGHSMGGILAVELAARRPEKVGTVALVNFPFFHSPTEVRGIADRLGPLARLTVTGHWSAKILCGIMCSLRPFLILLAPLFVQGVPPSVARDALRHNFNSYSRSLQNVVINHRPDPACGVLANWPVTLLHGEEDPVVPVDNVRSLVEKFPEWRLETLAGGGHLLPIDHPKEIAKLLKTALLN